MPAPKQPAVQRRAQKWIHRGPGGSLGQQAQAILADAHDIVAAWPKELVKLVRPYAKPVGRVQGISFASKLISWLTQLSTQTIRNTVSHVAKLGPHKRPLIIEAKASFQTNFNEAKASCQ